MKVGTDGILLGAWAPIDGVNSALDIGAGTGLLSVMLAQRASQLDPIIGVEIDERSYYEAKENFEQSPWADRLNIVHQSIQDFANEVDFGFDLIISNPPFFTGGTLSESQTKNNVRHTIKLPHSDLLRSVKRLLNPKGRFTVILPTLEGYRFIELAEQYGLYESKITMVKPTAEKEIERLLINFRTKPVDRIVESELILRDGQTGQMTEDYSNLVSDFYL
ncbi:methyltransferase [Membranihabitans marinus]